MCSRRVLPLKTFFPENFRSVPFRGMKRQLHNELQLPNLLSCPCKTFWAKGTWIIPSTSQKSQGQTPPVCFATVHTCEHPCSLPGRLRGCRPDKILPFFLGFLALFGVFVLFWLLLLFGGFGDLFCFVVCLVAFLVFLTLDKKYCISLLILLGHHNHQNSLAFTMKTPTKTELTLKCLVFVCFFS